MKIKRIVPLISFVTLMFLSGCYETKKIESKIINCKLIDIDMDRQFMGMISYEFISTDNEIFEISTRKRIDKIDTKKIHKIKRTLYKTCYENNCYDEIEYEYLNIINNEEED